MYLQYYYILLYTIYSIMCTSVPLVWIKEKQCVLLPISSLIYYQKNKSCHFGRYG